MRQQSSCSCYGRMSCISGAVPLQRRRTRCRQSVSLGRTAVLIGAQQSGSPMLEVICHGCHGHTAMNHLQVGDGRRAGEVLRGGARRLHAQVVASEVEHRRHVEGRRAVGEPVQAVLVEVAAQHLWRGHSTSGRIPSNGIELDYAKQRAGASLQPTNSLHFGQRHSISGFQEQNPGQVCGHLHYMTRLIPSVT